MRMEGAIYFIVEGTCRFPFALLWKDQACPATEVAALLLGSTHWGNLEDTGKKIRIELVSRAVPGWLSEVSWSRAGWPIIRIEIRIR